MHHYGQVVDRSTDTMKRLIQDLLDLQRIERGQFSVEPRPVELAPLVEEALEPMAAVAAEKSIRIETRLAQLGGQGVGREPARNRGQLLPHAADGGLERRRCDKVPQAPRRHRGPVSGKMGRILSRRS
jgi:signal transduction histidine kinase